MKHYTLIVHLLILVGITGIRLR